MPKEGDSYTVIIQRAHMEWGTHRHTNTRGVVFGEGYFQIPASVARDLDIYNSNNEDANNIYSCSSSDGHLNDASLKACGCSHAGDIHAKQFEGNGNLQTLGTWYDQIGAQEGDKITLTWTSPTNIIVKKI